MRANRLSTSALVATVAAAFAFAGSANAQSADGKYEQQIQDLQKQIQELKDMIKASAASAAKAAAPAPVRAVTEPEAPVASAAPKAGDQVVLTVAPIGYRMIDTNTTKLGIYGLIDLTLATESSGGPNANPNSATKAPINQRWTGMDVSWMNGNRWGFAGSHLLDKDSQTNLVMKLESEFELPTGNFDGGYGEPVIFNRDAWIGFQSPTLGLLTFGRQDSLGRDIMMIWANPFSTAKNGYSEGGWMNNQVMYQLMEYSGSPTGNRWDDAIVWKKIWGNWVSFAGWQLNGLQNSNLLSGATDVVDTGKGIKGSQQAVGLGYNSSDDSWHASASFTHANYDGYAKRVSSIGGNIRPVSWLRLNGGVIDAKIEQPVFGDRKDKVWTLSAQLYPEGSKFDYALAYYHIKADNAGYSNGLKTFTAPGATLQPFDLTGVELTCNGGAASGCTAGAANGTWSTLYGAAWYRWDSQTDFYLAAAKSQVGGGYVNPYAQGNASFSELGMGVRYFF